MHVSKTQGKPFVSVLPYPGALSWWGPLLVSFNSNDYFQEYNIHINFLLSIIHKIFETNSSFHSKWSTTRKV